MATFITTRQKTKAVIRKQGHPTQCKTFIKKSDAIIWARKVESEIERGIFENTTKAKLTAFSKVLDEYYKSCQTRQLKALKFIKSHSRIINQHIGDVKLSDITSECLAQYRDLRLESVSPATTKLELGIVMRAIKHMVDEKGFYLVSLPKVSYPKVSNARDRRVSDHEIERLTAVISNCEVRVAIGLALETGMRRSELVNIQWQHINWATATIYIPVTKTNSPREVPLTAKASALLRSMAIKDIGQLFTIKADSISQSFQRACVKVGITNLKFHDLRHEATTRLFELGLNVIEVGTITGHKDLKMLNRYTHLSAEKLGLKIQKLQE